MSEEGERNGALLLNDLLATPALGGTTGEIKEVGRLGIVMGRIPSGARGERRGGDGEGGKGEVYKKKGKKEVYPFVAMMTATREGSGQGIK